MAFGNNILFNMANDCAHYYLCSIPAIRLGTISQGQVSLWFYQYSRVIKFVLNIHFSIHHINILKVFQCVCQVILTFNKVTRGQSISHWFTLVVSGILSNVCLNFYKAGIPKIAISASWGIIVGIFLASFLFVSLLTLPHEIITMTDRGLPVNFAHKIITIWQTEGSYWVCRHLRVMPLANSWPRT